jgi:hypothetical protein
LRINAGVRERGATATKKNDGDEFEIVLHESITISFMISNEEKFEAR